MHSTPTPAQVTHHYTITRGHWSKALLTYYHSIKAQMKMQSRLIISSEGKFVVS